MTHFVLNYDSLGYFLGQKWGLVPLSGTIVLFFICMKH